jgi:hypothetical protein
LIGCGEGRIISLPESSDHGNHKTSSRMIRRV